MKKLVLYYSYEGNTKAVAEAIAQTIEADIVKLVRVNETRTYGWRKKYSAYREVKGKKQPEIFPFKSDPRDYDIIFIGTPVWFDSYNPVYNTLFGAIKIYDRKVALFSTGEKPENKALEKFKKLLEDSIILGELHLVEPIWCDTDEEIEAELDKARKWAAELTEKAEKMLEEEELTRRKAR